MNSNRGFGTVRSLDYVILLCGDLEKMKTFYSSLFGFHIEEDRPDVMVFFRVGTLFLGLRRKGRPYDGPSVSETSAPIQISFRLPPADVDVAYETLSEQGVDAIEQPTN